jgi:hypothetical protein
MAKKNQDTKFHGKGHIKDMSGVPYSA